MTLLWHQHHVMAGDDWAARLLMFCKSVSADKILPHVNADLSWDVSGRPLTPLQRIRDVSLVLFHWQKLDCWRGQRSRGIKTHA